MYSHRIHARVPIISPTIFNPLSCYIAFHTIFLQLLNSSATNTKLKIRKMPVMESYRTPNYN